MSGHEGASVCADRPSIDCRHSCAVPVLQAARRGTEPQQRAESDRVPEFQRTYHKQMETFRLDTVAETGKWAKLQHDKLATEDGTLTLYLKRQESQRVEPRDRPEARGVPESGTQRQT